MAATAAPDGYTLLGASGGFTIVPSVQPNLGYDPVKDLAPVSLVVQSPFLLLTHPSLPVRSVKDLAALAKARPGALTYGSAGQGSSTHLVFALFTTLARLDITHVPYKSAAQSHMDVIGGSIPLAMAAVPSAAPSLASGALRALAVTSERRWPTLPDVPTIAENGYAGFSHMTWIGVFVPVGTPPAIVAKLNQEIAAALADPEVRDRISKAGAEAVGKSVADFDAMLKADYEAVGKLVSRIGLKVD
jgi:tripartite-type tricarboxylate transporter receptor subunit TctC